MTLVTFRLNSSMLNQYYDYKDSKEKKIKLLSSLFSVSILLSIGFLLIWSLLGEYIFSLAFKSEDVKFYPYGITILAYAALSEINACYYIFIKNERMLGRFLAVTLFQIISAIVFQFICIITLEMGVQGALVGMLVANVLTTLLILVLDRHVITLSPDWQMVRIGLKFSLPLLPYVIVFWFLTKGGKIALERYTDLDEVGLFALLVTITGTIILIVDAITNGVRPFLFDSFATKQKEENEKIELYISLITNLPLIMLPFIITVCYNIDWVTDKLHYSRIVDYALVCCLVTYLIVYVKLFYHQLVFVKRSGLITTLALITAVVLFVNLVVLVPTYGIWGLLVSTGIANGFLVGLFGVFAQRLLPIPFSIKKHILPGLTFFLVIYLLQLFSSSCLEPETFGLIQLPIMLFLYFLLNRDIVNRYRQTFMRSL